MNHDPSLADVSRTKVTRSLRLNSLLVVALARRSIRTWLIVVAVGLLCFCGKIDSSLAKTIFFDSFEDGDSRDGMPVTWAGGSMVVDGDLVLGGTNSHDLWPDGISLSDVSIRTQLRLVDGRVIGVFGRVGPPVEGITNTYGFMNPSRQFAGVGFAGNGGISTTSTGSIDFDARQEDAMLQFDMIGDRYSLWVWPAGESMPAEPLASATDDRLKEGGIGVWVDSVQGGPVKALFRYVHVADTHLTDASFLSLAGDIDGDGSVAFADFLVLSNNFGMEVPRYTLGDLNGDGSVQFADFLVLSNNFGQTAKAAAVPEPSTLVLLGHAGLLIGLTRRRRRLL